VNARSGNPSSICRFLGDRSRLEKMKEQLDDFAPARQNKEQPLLENFF
jgi:hypothetical protein